MKQSEISALLAEAIYINSAHQRVIEVLWPEFQPIFWSNFFLPFSNLISKRKGIYY